MNKLEKLLNDASVVNLKLRAFKKVELLEEVAQLQFSLKVLRRENKRLRYLVERRTNERNGASKAHKSKLESLTAHKAIIKDLNKKILDFGKARLNQQKDVRTILTPTPTIQSVGLGNGEKILD